MAGFLLVPTTATRRTSCSWVTVQSGCARFCWQPACEKIGFFRIQAQFPPSEKTFDQFSNGRSGYRAQYYLSPEEGVLYDRDVTQALIPVLADARARQSLPDDLGLVIASVDAPHAKVWVCGDHVLEMAEADSLNPPRWVHNNARLGRRAPRPSEPRLELKGAFIHPRSRELFVDELKADRACDLFGTGSHNRNDRLQMSCGKRPRRRNDDKRDVHGGTLTVERRYSEDWRAPTGFRTHPHSRSPP